MSKIQKWWVIDQEALQEHEDGNVVLWTDVVADYHPLLDDLRQHICFERPELRPPSILLKRIDELLNEEK